MAQGLTRAESFLNCRICLEDLKDGRRLACNHCFCQACLEVYQNSNCQSRRLTCPLCRRVTELNNRNVDGLPKVEESTQTTHFVDQDWYNDPDDFGLDKLFESSPACTMCSDATGTDETGGTNTRAVIFCRECEQYMCESCLSSHRRLSKVFSGHSLLSIEDALNERSLLGADTCSEHKTDRKGFFCEDCQAMVCQKCIIARHNIRHHSIRDRGDFELEIRENIDALMMRVNERKKEIQKHIKNIETKRRNIKGTIDKVLFNITEAHRIAMECLGERKAMLMERVRRVEHEHNEMINEMKENARRKSVRLSQMCEALERDRYGGLEGEGLRSHNRLCQETKSQLSENRETEGIKGNLARLQQSADKLRFVRVDEGIVLGNVVTIAPEEEQPIGLQINKLVQMQDEDVDRKQSPRGGGDQANTSVNNVVATTPEEEQPIDLQINKLVQIQDEDVDRKQSPRGGGDQANTSVNNVVATTPEEEQPIDLQINKLVHMQDDDVDEKQSPRGGGGDQATTPVNNGKNDDCSTFAGTFRNDIPVTKMVKRQPVFWCRKPWLLVKQSKFPYSEPACMAVLTPESVVVGYWNNPAIKISLKTKESPDFLPKYSAKATCISFLQSGRIVILDRDGYMGIYSSEGIPTGDGFLTSDTPQYFDTDQNDDIFMLTGSDRISVYSSFGGPPLRTLATRERPSNIHVGSRCCVVQSLNKIAVISSSDGSDIWRLKRGESRDRVAVDKESNILYVATPQQAPEGLPICLRSFNLRDGSQLDSCMLDVAAGPILAMKVMSSDMISILTSRTLYIFKKDS